MPVSEARSKEEKLVELGLQSIAERRMEADQVMVYKFLTDCVRAVTGSKGAVRPRNTHVMQQTDSA